jgi:hypothetical protein
MRLALALFAVLCFTGCSPINPGSPTTQPTPAYIALDQSAETDLLPSILRDETANPGAIATADAAILTAWQARIANPPVGPTYVAGEVGTFNAVAQIVARDVATNGDVGPQHFLWSWWFRLQPPCKQLGVAPPTTEPAP